MKKLIFWLLAGLPAMAQVSVSPISQPHVTFVDASGAACAGCTLATYAAGTTTPQSSYTDSGGVSQNTNPIVLDAAGGANIWMSNNSYKLLLKDASGNTIWSVDNVKGGGGVGGVCGPSGAVQIANSGVNGLTCDSTIIINTTNHSLTVGTLPNSHVIIGALGTPTTWNFDTTTSATALSSLGAGLVGAGTVGQIPIYAAAGNNLTPSTALPNGITAFTQNANDNSTKVATTAYVKTPGVITPTSIAIASGNAMTGNQGNGAYVQHSTGTTTSGNCAKFDANGNTVDAGGICGNAGTQKNCLLVSCAGGTYTSSGGTYFNSGTRPVLEEITITLAGSSGTGGQYQIASTISGLTGPASQIGNVCGSNPPASITFMVPAGASFTVTPSVISNCSPAGTWAITSWIEVAQ